MPTILRYFDPADLPFLENEGWQLLDVELSPQFQDSSGILPKFAPYFGIFVDTSFVELEDTRTAMMTDDTELEIEDLAADNMGFARLIDIECDGYIKGPCNSKGDICEAGWPTYTHVWLIPD